MEAFSFSWFLHVAQGRPPKFDIRLANVIQLSMGGSGGGGGSFTISSGGLYWLVNLELQQQVFPVCFLHARLWP